MTFDDFYESEFRRAVGVVFGLSGSRLAAEEIRVVTHDRPVRPGSRRSLAVVAVVFVLGLVAGFGALSLSRLGGESDDVAIVTDGDVDTDEAAGDADADGAAADGGGDASANNDRADDGGAAIAASGVAPMATDAPPDGFTFERINSASDMGEPTALLATQVYGVPGQPGPADGDEQLTVNWSLGDAAPPMSGDPIPLRGGDGYRRGDGAVGFEEKGIAVWVRSTTLDEVTLIQLAEAVVVTAEGPEPIVGAPGELEYLGAIRSGLYDGPGSSVPPDGHSTDYSGGTRALSIMSGPAESGTDVMLLWTSNAEVAELGGQDVVLVEESEFISAAWVDGEVLLRAFGSVTRDELDAVISALRPANEAELAREGDGDGPSVTPPDGPAGDTAALGSAQRVATTAVPDGLTIQASGDHAGLGEPLFTSERHLYGPDEGEASIAIAFGPPSHPFPGETVEVEGVDVVIVDKEAANTGTDLNFAMDSQGVTLRGAGAGVDPDTLLEAAADYIRAGGVEDLTVLSNGYRHRGMEETMLWEVGSTVLNGPGSGTSIVYGTADEFDRRLHMTSAPVAAGGDVGWYTWLYPDETEIVSIAGIDAELARPGDDWWVARFVSGDRVIELRGTLLSRDEVLAAAAALRPATDVEWNVGVG